MRPYDERTKHRVLAALEKAKAVEARHFGDMAFVAEALAKDGLVTVERREVKSIPKKGAKPEVTRKTFYKLSEAGAARLKELGPLVRVAPKPEAVLVPEEPEEPKEPAE